MPVATPQQYREMLDAAQKGGYAYPASTGGAQFASGLGIGDMAFGAIVLAEAIHRLAEKYDILIALHTDHCHPKNVEPFLKPLLQASRDRIAEGKGPLFQSHMYDGSELPLEENMAVSKELLKECAELDIILEIEAGVVGGEEDGHDTSGLPAEKLYTTPEDMVTVYESLNGIGRFMFAATFGNVHGAYKPGAVKLEPAILRDGQRAVMDKYGADAEMDLVFHGGSGSELDDIRETIGYGVIKMNIDTDTQYAFTRVIATHIFENVEGIFKIDGEVGNKKVYDPRSYIKKAEQSLCDRLKIACDDLLSTGKSIYNK